MALPLLRPLEDPADPPTLGSRERPRGDDLDLVADLALVALVVGGEGRGPLHIAVVEAVGDGVLDRHDDRLVHLVARDPPDLDLPAAAVPRLPVGRGRR